ncbi:aromatic aminotransferase Aro8 [Hymenopellis radicata]|nr:aromatic aminotransferase Aro8 [Hymenopellis radicata]
MQYMWEPGMVSLAGGLPHPSLFPFAGVEVDVYSPEADLSTNVSSDVIHVTVPKYDSEGQVNLATSLQYSPSTGLKWLLDYAREFVNRVFKPQYKDFDVLLHMGNTDGWTKVVNLLCEYGDYIIVAEYTFSTAQAVWIPMGCKGVPIKMDASGMRADVLEETLRDWDITHPNVKRPHVLYTVPTGHNPTGTVISAQRKQEIYDVCVKYDLIIVEDDPYYFLQFKDYVPGDVDTKEEEPYDEAAFLASLEKTFLSFDTQGRVIRMDSFSKTLAPGNRVGWFTANPLFCERLLRATEVTVQTPSGWSQAIIAQMLKSWSLSGYLRWLSRLRLEYQVRRTWMCDAIAHSFDVKKGSPDEGLFRTRSIGMFLWVKVYLDANPTFQNVKGSSLDPEAEYEKILWRKLVNAKVLLMAGSFFTPWQGKEKATTTTSGREHSKIFFRLSYSTPTQEDMELGIQRLAEVFRAEWSVPN